MDRRTFVKTMFAGAAAAVVVTALPFSAEAGEADARHLPDFNPANPGDLPAEGATETQRWRRRSWRRRRWGHRYYGRPVYRSRPRRRCWWRRNRWGQPVRVCAW